MMTGDLLQFLATFGSVNDAIGTIQDSMTAVLSPAFAFDIRDAVIASGIQSIFPRYNGCCPFVGDTIVV